MARIALQLSSILETGTARTAIKRFSCLNWPAHSFVVYGLSKNFASTGARLFAYPAGTCVYLS